MPYRLVGIIDSVEQGFLLATGDNLLGAASDCDLCIDHPTVSRKHARIIVGPGSVQIVDAGSHNGTYIEGEKVDRASLEPGMSVAFGKVKLRLEEVSDVDIVLGLEIDSSVPEEGAGANGPKHTTVGFRSMANMPLDLLPDLLRRVEAGEGEHEVVRAAAAALFDGLPVASAEVRCRETGAVVFEASRNLGTRDVRELTAVGHGTALALELHADRRAETLEPVLELVGTVLRIAAGRESPDLRAVPPERVPARRPDPPTVAPAVQRIYDEAEQVAQGDVGVLIGGESGTGKEVLARFIHDASPRGSCAFVALNCAALPNDLLEAELFGIERGVATGVDERPGKFEAAHDGTLFLDEIGDMNLQTQAKILRVLQEGVVYRLGATQARPARCRIIAASNRDLGAMRAGGDFREDLYYRIAVWVVEIPPLRHRADDIANLAAHFLQHAAKKRGHRVRGISVGALEALRSYRWPGNIRQLQNEMARVALFLNDGEVLDSSRLSDEILHPTGRAAGGTLEERLENQERLEILAAFRRCGGNASDVAKDLGIGRSTLYRRMKHLEISSGTDEG